MRLGVRWARRCSLVLTVVVVCLTGSVRAVTEPSVTESAPYREVYGGRSTVDHVDVVSSVDVVETVDVVNSAALEPVAGRRLLLVSTLDGRLTALDPAAGGAPLWTLSQQGQWVRLIPALDGRLFSYDGEQVEALPVTADTLLQASYRFADDTVIMGGSQVSTLGIDVNTGRLRYRCGAAGSDLAEGTLSGTEHGKKWQHRFAGPLVHVWRLDGGKLHEVDLLAPAADDPGRAPASALPWRTREAAVHSAEGNPMLLTDRSDKALALRPEEYPYEGGYYLYSSGDCVLESEPESEPERTRPQPAPRSNFLENFEPVQCLGKGGFGVVFEAKNLLDDHHYAVKRIRLPDREKSRRRVLREVSCLAKLEHRNIVRYFYCWKEQLSVESLQEQDRVLDTSEWASSPTPLNSVASGGGSAPASPEDLSGSVLKLTRFSSALPGGGERSGRQRTIGGGFLPALADSSPRRRPRHGDSSALSADDSIVFSNDCSRVPGRFSNGTPRRRTLKDSLLSAPTADGDEDDSVVFAAESGQPLVDYTIPDTTGASSSAVSGPLVAFQTNRSPGQDGTGFWDDEEEDTGDAPDAAAWYLFIQMQLCRKGILNGVEYVHSQGLMHRDLKPSNIFFAPDGTVKIGDFGLATTTVSGEPTSHTPAQLSSAAGGHTDQVGTQLYMSPEQVLGRSYDYRVDIYSLGIILFELLVPFLDTDGAAAYFDSGAAAAVSGEFPARPAGRVRPTGADAEPRAGPAAVHSRDSPQCRQMSVRVPRPRLELQLRLRRCGSAGG
ncbi:Eukaryotic translation initiation factor 2-alpha kinase 1 [Amphibalanus amphitrite]|uniref:PRKR-like endoplasmic reticulum kinase n=1 Tax=Amphibalanus amphitrite TaxID=1232801 RepID=A0A6A4WNG2_AMPAM|nr:Eukaryotic translation initiation factor 2-alpha kinase 1 [Amphibalanus amphitrite]